MKMKTVFFVALMLAIGIFSFGAANLRFTTSLTISPASPSTGDTVTCTVTWKAQNDDAVNARIIGGIDGITIYDNTFANVPSGETRTISFTWTATAGGHNAWFHMDPDNLTGDPYPSNNYIEQAFTVGSSGSGHPTMTTTTTYTLTAVDPNKLKEDKICLLNSNKTTDLSITYYKIKAHDTNKYMKSLQVNFKNNGQKCLPVFRFHVIDSFGQIIRNIEVTPLFDNTYTLYANQTRTYSFFIHTDDFNGKFETCKTKIKVPGSSVNQPTVTKVVTVKCSKLRVNLDPTMVIAETNEGNNTSAVETALWLDGIEH